MSKMPRSIVPQIKTDEGMWRSCLEDSREAVYTVLTCELKFLIELSSELADLEQDGMASDVLVEEIR